MRVSRFGGTAATITIVLVVFLVQLHSGPRALAMDFDGNVDKWGNGKDHLLLVSVSAMERVLDRPSHQERVTYHVHVALDVDGSLTGNFVIVTGLLGNLHSDLDAPLLAKGDVTVLHVSASPDPTTFVCDPYMTLPIGLDTSLVIPPKDVELVRNALLAMAKGLRLRGAAGQAAAAELFKNQSYYCWALGASILAMQQTPDSSRELHDHEFDGITMGQFLWIDFLFGDVVTVAVPSPATRLNDFRRYFGGSAGYPLHR